MTAITYTGCVLCDGSGTCRVCFGTGGQFYPNIGMMPCGRCFGNGRCQACGGKGYNVINSRTQYDITVDMDEQGNIYVASGNNSGHECSSSSDREKVEKLNTFQHTVQKPTSMFIVLNANVPASAIYMYKNKTIT